MSERKLFYVNALLVVLAAWLGMRLVSLESHRAGHVMAIQGALREDVPDEVQSVKAASYAAVAQKMLFSRDRNADVLVPAPFIHPMVPPPMPPLPKLHGVMMVGGNPRVILSVGAEGQKIYGFGDRIGGWEIVKFDSKTISLKWLDKEIIRDFAELVDSSPVPVPVQVANKPVEPAAGAVVDGMKKVCVASPFGNKCYWEPVK